MLAPSQELQWGLRGEEGRGENEGWRRGKEKNGESESSGEVSPPGCVHRPPFLVPEAPRGKEPVFWVPSPRELKLQQEGT